MFARKSEPFPDENKPPFTALQDDLGHKNPWALKMSLFSCGGRILTCHTQIVKVDSALLFLFVRMIEPRQAWKEQVIKIFNNLYVEYLSKHFH